MGIFAFLLSIFLPPPVLPWHLCSRGAVGPGGAAHPPGCGYWPRQSPPDAGRDPLGQLCQPGHRPRCHQPPRTGREHRRTPLMLHPRGGGFGGDHASLSPKGCTAASLPGQCPKTTLFFCCFSSLLGPFPPTLGHRRRMPRHLPQLHKQGMLNSSFF